MKHMIMVAIVPDHLQRISRGVKGHRLLDSPVTPREILDVGRKPSILEVEYSVAD